MALFLGFDSSTQGLTALVVDCTGRERRIILERSFDYDLAFPGYGTHNGVWRRAGAEVTAPPLMWAEALDRMMEVIASERSVDPKAIAAISGAAQQHGSVYLNASAAETLESLTPRVPLTSQLTGAFSRGESPVWMDESTSAQCEAISRALGGRQAVAELTGSAPFERFTGPQIRKFFERNSTGYRHTSRIHLVSSFLASLLAGQDAPVEPGDAAGTNLLDWRTCTWAPAALDATAPSLHYRLPRVVPSSTVVGPLSSYWRERYGFGDALVVAWTGDNPSALVGSGLFSEGALGISLGTSDTLFGFSAQPRPTASGSCHIFGAPSGGYMSLVCFRNGSLAREAIRDQYGYTWSDFSRALRATPAGNNGGLMLPWFEPEITPHVGRPGVRRLRLSAGDPDANVRAVVEGQMMAMANRSGVVTRNRIERLLASGGASVNRDILQVMADVFDAEVVAMARGNAAALGAALRAFHAHEHAKGRGLSWREVSEGVHAADPAARVTPIQENVSVYASLRPQHAEFEKAEALTATSTGGLRQT